MAAAPIVTHRARFRTEPFEPPTACQTINETRRRASERRTRYGTGEGGPGAAIVARESRGLLAVRYRAGDVALLAVLDAERSPGESEAGVARARADAAADMVALYRALGGGWRTTTRSPAGGTSR